MIEDENRKETGNKSPRVEPREAPKLKGNATRRHGSAEFKSRISGKGSTVSQSPSRRSSQFSASGPYPKLMEKHNMKPTEERLADVRETIH